MPDAWDQFPDAPQGQGADPWAQFPDAQGPGRPEMAMRDPNEVDPVTGRTRGDMEAELAVVKPEPRWRQILRTGLKEGARTVGLGGRSVLNAVASPALLAADAGIAARNLATGSQYGGATQAFNEGLDALGTPRPETMPEKVSDFASQVIVGGRLPAPSAGTSLAGFGGQQAAKVATSYKPNTLKEAALATAQRAGYVVPPATAKASGTNRVLEGVAGKLTTGQMASAKNTETTNALAKKALGISDNEVITPELLNNLRRQAAEAYKTVRSVGTMRLDSKYTAALDDIANQYKGAEEAFPTLAKGEVKQMVEGLKKASVDSDAAIDAIAILREKASAAFAQGDKALGSAYKKAAGAMESAIERSLQRRGKDAGEILKAFREARVQIAKTYTVDKALNQTTGNVSATKIAQELAKGKPLTGELKQIGQFGQVAPKAARDFNESLPGISPLDFYASGGVTAATQQPWYLLYPFVRQATRATILNPSVNQALTKTSTKVPEKAVMNAAAGANALRQ